MNLADASPDIRAGFEIVRLLTELALTAAQEGAEDAAACAEFLSTAVVALRTQLVEDGRDWSELEAVLDAIPNVRNYDLTLP